MGTRLDAALWPVGVGYSNPGRPQAPFSRPVRRDLPGEWSLRPDGGALRPSRVRQAVPELSMPTEALPLKPALVCRPALPVDTPAVLDLTARIWDGGDYVPRVWD